MAAHQVDGAPGLSENVHDLLEDILQKTIQVLAPIECGGNTLEAADRTGHIVQGDAELTRFANMGINGNGRVETKTGECPHPACQ